MRKINLKDFQTANHRILRDINEVIVLNVIRERQPIPRVGIADITGLEEGTISRIIQRFLRQGLVYESGVGTSTPVGGRRPRFVHLNPSRTCAIGVDIGPRETQLALSDMNGHLQRLTRISHTHNASRSLAEVAEEILALASQTSRYSEFGGVGVSLIGLVDVEEGSIIEGQDLGWGDRIEVGKMLRAKLGSDVPLYYDNGARLSALGEIWFGSTHLSGFRDIVFVVVSEGIGSGIIVNGQLYRGFRNGAGEFGHVCVDPSGPKCSCGSSGCLEVFASDLATANRYMQAASARKKTSQAAPDMDRIVEMARSGEKAAITALKETSSYLGLGLAPIIYSLNPEAIVIGGKIAEAWDLIERDLLEACARRTSPTLLRNTRIFPSSLHVRPSLMGAIALVLAQHFAAPKTI